MRKHILGVVTLLLLTEPGSLLFADDETASPPAPPTPEEIEQLRTNTAHVLDPGTFEIDEVVSFLRYEDLDTAAAVTELEYGLIQGVMIELEIPFRMVDPDPGDREYGLGDVEVEGKVLLAKPGIFTFSAGAELECPTGDEDEGLGSGKWEFGMAGLASVWLGDYDVAVHAELGAEWEEGEGVEEGFFNAAVEYYGLDDVVLQLGFNAQGGEGKPVVSIIPGFQFEIEEVLFEEFEVGFGFPIGLSEEAQDWGVIIDLEVEF